MRLQAKAKVNTYFNAYKKTGNNVPKTKLSNQDLQINNIFGKYGTGLSIQRELGFSEIKKSKICFILQAYNSQMRMRTNRFQNIFLLYFQRR